MSDAEKPKDPRMVELGKMPKRPRGARSAGSHHGPATLCGSPRKAARGGGTCTKGAGEGTDHPGVGRCKYHGGTSPSGKTHAAREAATRALETLGHPYGNGDPFALLRDVVRYAHGQTRAAAALVLDAVDAAGKPDAVPIVPLDEAVRLLDRVLRTAGLTGKETVDADVADREVAIAQVQAEQMVAAFRRALEAAGVGGETRMVAERALIAELRAPAGADGGIVH